MIRLHVSAANWQKSMDKVRPALPACRAEACRGMANVTQSAFAVLCPEDTHRLKRGWLEATGEAGADLRPLPALNASRGAKQIYNRIVGQWVHIHRQRLALEKKMGFLYPPGKALGPAGREMQSDLKWLIKREGKLKDQVDKFLPVKDGPVIVIGGRGLNPFATVRTQVYGGRGKIQVVSRDVSVMVLWNREPHASIVNSNTGLSKKVAHYVKLAGGKPMSARYLKRLNVARGAKAFANP